MLSKNVLLWCLFLFFLSPFSAYAYIGPSAGKLCPTKVVGTQTIKGMYWGWSERYNGLEAIDLRDESERTLVFVATTKEKAKQIFGKTFIGFDEEIPVKVTYNTVQKYSEQREECELVHTLKEAEVLKGDGVSLSTYEDVNASKVLYKNTVEGEYLGHDEGEGGYPSVNLLIDGKIYFFLYKKGAVHKMFGKNPKGKRFALTYSVEQKLGDGLPIYNWFKSVKKIQ